MPNIHNDVVSSVAAIDTKQTNDDGDYMVAGHRYRLNTAAELENFHDRTTFRTVL